MRWACFVLIGCAGAPPAPIANVSPPQTGPLPCGARTIAELDPERATTTRCAAVKQGLYEGAKLIVESRGLGELVAFDPRVPGPAEIRVGLTGGDVERLAPEYTTMKCSLHDKMTMCLLESGRDQELDCDNAGVGGITIYFEAVPEATGPCCDYPLTGAKAREVLRHHSVLAVQVRDPVCSGE